MKNVTMIFLPLFLCCSLSAQTGNNEALSVNEKTHQNLNFKKSSTLPESRKGLPTSVSALAIIWSDDFSNPGNWTINTPVGTGVGKDWVIGTGGPAGAFAIPTILSTTAANGFALFDSDFNCSYDQIADITTSLPINCSAYPFVRLNFEQQYLRYRDSTFVFVSNDGFAWTKYPVNVAVTGDYGYSVNPENIKVDISATAGGQATVWVRFQFYSPNSLGFGSGCNYAWMVDDVSITELPLNELVIDRAYNDFAYEDGGYYTQTPITQIVPLTFRAAISNEGALAQTSVMLNVKISDGTSILYNQNSAVLPTVAYQAEDTLSIATTFTPPATIKNYSTTFHVSQTEIELAVDTINNRVIKDFTITDTVYARDNGIATGTVTPNSYPGGAVDDARIGLKYEFPVSATATSISAYLDVSSGSGTYAQAKLYEIVSGVYTEIAVSPIYTVGLSVSEWINFPIALTSLTAGKTYLAAIVISGVATGPDLFVVLGADRVTQQPKDICQVYLPGLGYWNSHSVLPMIRLNILYPFAGVSEKTTDDVILFQNIPNPAKASSVINFQLKKNAAVVLNIMDVRGEILVRKDLGMQDSGNHSVSVNTLGLQAGVYFYSIMVDNKTTPSMKMVIID